MTGDEEVEPKGFPGFVLSPGIAPRSFFVTFVCIYRVGYVCSSRVGHVFVLCMYNRVRLAAS